MIGKEGSMIKLIKDNSGCDITIGQNGLVWLKGKSVESEMLAKEAIIFITQKSFVSGLTEKVQQWFDEKLKKEKNEETEVKEE